MMSTDSGLRFDQHMACSQLMVISQWKRFIFTTRDQYVASQLQDRIATCITRTLNLTISVGTIHRDTCHPIRIAIQFARIAIPAILQLSCVFI